MDFACALENLDNNNSEGLKPCIIKKCKKDKN